MGPAVAEASRPRCRSRRRIGRRRGRRRDVVGAMRRGFFIFLFFISIFYKNIFSICKFTEIYPGRPAAGRPGPGRPAAPLPGGRDLAARQPGGRGLSAKKDEIKLQTGPWGRSPGCGAAGPPGPPGCRPPLAARLLGDRLCHPYIRVGWSPTPHLHH